MCCCNQKTPDDLWVFGSMFTSPNEYSNPLLKGRFRIKMRGHESLVKDSEWSVLENGGFKIFIVPGWVVSLDTKILVEFY